jgi:hypothetical protein
MPLSATDLSCGSPTLCLAVDDQGRASRFNGTGWWAPVAALPNTYGGGARVSCAPAGPCMLVSSDGTYRRYVGTAFTTTQRMPQGFSAQDVVLSCGAPSACIVVLDQGAWAQWNGSVWTAHPAEMTAYRLGSLTCLTATHCLATHPYSNDTVPEVWNSGVWSDDGTYTPDEIPFAPECPTPDTCFVAGGTTVSRSS